MFLSRDGLYTIDASSSLSELSSLINPLFDNNELSKRRAVSQVWADKQLVIIQYLTKVIQLVLLILQEKV